MIGSSDPGVIDQVLSIVGKDDQEHVFEICLKHQSGEEINTRIMAAPVRDGNGSTSDVVFTLNNKHAAENIDPKSETKQSFEELRWLSDQGRTLLSIHDWSDLLVHAGEAYLEICKPAFVLVLSQVETNTLKLEGVHGLGKGALKKVEGLLGGKLLKGRSFDIEDRFIGAYSKRRLTHHPGGLVNFAINHIPEKISRKLAKTFNVHDVYTIGLEGNHSVLGCIYILTQMPQQELPVDLIEAYTFQVALALEKNKYALDLKESEQRFQMIFEHAPDGYYINDSKGKLIAGNLAAERMVGYDRGDLIGKKLIDLGIMPREHLPRAGAMFAKNKLGRSTGPDWFPLLRGDGTVVDAEITTHPVKINDQSLTLGIARDITERKKVERNLTNSHDNLKNVLENIDAHVYVADMESFEILYMNQRMIKDFGGDFTGRVCFEVFCAEQKRCDACTNNRLIDSDGNPGETVIWEQVNRVTEKWYRNYDRAIYWQDQQLVRLQIAVDITDHINASRDLEESELRFRSLFESSGNALMTISPPNWTFTSGNSALVELFGFEDEQEFLSYRPWDLSPEYQPDGKNSQNKALEMIQLCLDRGSNEFHWIHKKKTGEEIPAIVRLTRVDLDQESFVQATVIDITESVNSERILQEQMQQLKIINDLNIAANQGLDLEGIFKRFSDQLKNIYQIIDTHIYLINSDSQSISSKLLEPTAGLRKIIEGYSGEFLPPMVTIPLRTSPFYEELVRSANARIITNSEIIEGLIGETLVSVLGSGAAGKKISKIASMIYKQANIRSMAIVPLISGNKIIGLVDFVSTENLPDTALDWLKTATDQLSGIIQSVQAKAERASSIKELELINRAIVLGGRLDSSDEICELLADEVQGVNPDAIVMVTLQDPGQSAIRVKALRGLGKFDKQLTKILGKKPQEVEIDVSENVLDDKLTALFTSGNLELIPNGLFDLTRGAISRQICRAIENTIGIDRIYFVGFGFHGESIGGLIIGTRKDQKVQFPAAIETITNYFAEVFETRRAQGEVLQRKKHLEALRSVELDITSKLHLGDLLFSIAEKAAEIVNASGSGFSVYNAERNYLDYIAYTGFERLPERRIIEVGEGLSGKVWEQQQTIIIENYTLWPGRSKTWEEIGNYYLAGIPVCWGEEPLGVLEIALPVGEKLSQADISLLEMFAVQAAIAIKNAQLYSREKIKRQEAETLQEVSLMVNSHLERSELLDSILIALQDVVPYHSASIQLVQGEYVVIEAFRGDEGTNGVIGKKFKISENALAKPVLVEGKNVILDDVSDNSDWIAGPETTGIHSWIAVPLAVKGNIIGLLTLDHKNIAQYQEKDAELVFNFATQVAIALENSTLFEDAKNRLFKIESLRQIDLAISGSVDLDISMNVLVRQLMNSLDVDAATVLIYNDQLKSLQYIAGHGFITDSLQHTSLRLGEGLAGKAALASGTGVLGGY